MTQVDTEQEDSVSQQCGHAVTGQTIWFEPDPTYIINN